MSLEKGATAPLDKTVATKLAAVMATNKFTGTIKNGSLTASDGSNSLTLANVLLPDGEYSFSLSATNGPEDYSEVTFLKPLVAPAPVAAPKPAKQSIGQGCTTITSASARRR